MKLYQLTLFALCLLTLNSCKKQPEIIIPTFTTRAKPFIDPVFASYFSSFLEEGRKRGVTFTTEEQDITIKLSKVPTSFSRDSWGLTNYNSRTIDIDSLWITAPAGYKESLVYHELGHLLLGRHHTTEKLANGEYRSIMYTKNDNADKCTHPIFSGNLRKTYYLDELFDSNTPAPSWATENTTWRPSSTTSYVLEKNKWLNTNRLDSLEQKGTVPFSYSIDSETLTLKINNQPANSGISIPITTFFPFLNDSSLVNYEIQMRYKLYGQDFVLGWQANDLPQNMKTLQTNYCDPNHILLGDQNGGYFFNRNIHQDLNGWNEIILKHQDNNITIWQNGLLLFQSDILPSPRSSPLKLFFHFYSSQYDFEYISVARL